MTAETVNTRPLSLFADKLVPASVRLALSVLPNIKGGLLRLRLPDGRTFLFGDGKGPTAEVAIRDYRFARRVLFSGDIGFAEGWNEGEWTSPDLATALSLLADNAERLTRSFNGGPLGQLINSLTHLGRANTRGGSRRNILAHYDLGNAFYAAWLDPSMSYSSARYSADADLEAAQAEKYRAVARHAHLKAGDRVLEIGCGWGGFAELAAREFGAHVTAITISDEQFAFARNRIDKAGLASRVDIRRQDYRDVEGQFDAVVSIEMLEAVGERYWPTFFNKVTSALKPGGRASIQVITIRDDLFANYRRRVDFIQRYVFPGGMLPSIHRLKEEAGRAGLRWEALDQFGRDYERTLVEWSRRFERNWSAIAAQGFDERFRRFWLFYLAYCTAGFRTGRTDVVQVALSKSPLS